MKHFKSLFVIQLILPFTLFLGCNNKDEQKPAPIADFSLEVNGKSVTFKNNSLYAESYRWEFGDGNTSTDESLEYSYYRVGVYQARLIVSNGIGEDIKETEIEIYVTPEAVFSYKVDGRSITFINESIDAETYEWHFGDGKSSMEVSPTHLYPTNGNFSVQLKAKNALDENTSEAILDVINIKIDGDFSDWDQIENAYFGERTISSLKIANMGNDVIFLYLEGTHDLTDLSQIVLNIDNDKTTGAFIDWLYTESGEDLLIEGQLLNGENQAAMVYECQPCDGSNPGNWNWGSEPVNEDTNSIIQASSLVTIENGKAYELAIYLKKLNPNVSVSKKAIGIAILDLSIDNWTQVGAVPTLVSPNQPASQLIEYSLE